MEPFPPHKNKVPPQRSNIKGNKFCRLFNAWVSSVQYRSVLLPGGQSDLRQGRVGVAAATDVGEQSGLAWQAGGRVEERDDNLYL